MTASLELVALDGPLEGERFALRPKEPMLVGRSRKGIHVADPMVSLEHAEISYSADRYVITDLGSQTGTFVDDRKLEPHAPCPLRPGVIIKIGETSFEVEVLEPSRRWILLASALGGALGGLALVVAIFGSRTPDYTATIHGVLPIRQGAHTSTDLVVPEAFIRQNGLADADLAIARITDFDKDGVDEVWLVGKQHEWVVTFPATGGWKMLGTLPLGCNDEPGLTFPNLRCGTEVWRFDHTYAAAGQEGVVAWLVAPPPPEPAPKAPKPPPPLITPGLHPFQLTLDASQLGGFLQARGVDEPVQYVICENSVVGLRPQVLTASGRIAALSLGCIGDLDLRTQDAEPVPGVRVAAVAFTASGRASLLADLTTFLSGGPDGLFLDAAGHTVVDSWSTPPQPKPSVILSMVGHGAFLNRVASEGAVVTHRLLTLADANAPPPPVGTAVLSGPGQFTVDPPGCSKLQVETWRWHCQFTRLCTPGMEFLEVRQVGCGAEKVLLQAPFGGTVSGGDGHVEVRAVVDAEQVSGRTDVLRARVAWRTAERDVAQSP